jgi:peptidoglycan/xylan/chitin deacetylase (PgdA/CDA1 family)
MTPRRKPLLKVLMFHGVVRDLPPYAVYRGTNNCLIRESDFETCIRWCVRTHKVATLRDLPRYLNGAAADPAVLISFDDGLASVIDTAVPVLQKYGATAVVFVTTGWIDAQETPAIFRLERDLWETPPAELRVRVGDHQFTAAVGRRSAVSAALARLWCFCFSRRIAPLSIPSANVLFDGKPWEPTSGRQERDVWFPASWDELADVARTGVIEIGAHGVSHTPWPWLSEEERRCELAGARDRLQDLTGHEVRACSYPHGWHDAATRADVGRYYDWAFTGEARSIGSDPVDALPRFFVPAGRPVLMDAIVHWPLAGRILRKGASLIGRE